MIRGPRQSDQNYIASTWVRSLAGVANRRLGRRGGEIGIAVDQVLDRGDTRALIRHQAGNRDHILGYVVFVEGAGVPVVHYIYVRQDYRGRGLATQLLREAGVTSDSSVVCTSLGPDSARIRSRYQGAVYMPLDEFLQPPKGIRP